MEKTCQALGLAHPHDRHGALLKDRASSAELDAALDAYRQACARACEDVRDRLRGLARSLMVRRQRSHQTCPGCHESPPLPSSSTLIVKWGEDVLRMAFLVLSLQCRCTSMLSTAHVGRPVGNTDNVQVWDERDSVMQGELLRLVCNRSAVDVCMLRCRACSRSWCAPVRCPSSGLRSMPTCALQRSAAGATLCNCPNPAQKMRSGLRCRCVRTATFLRHTAVVGRTAPLQLPETALGVILLTTGLCAPQSPRTQIIRAFTPLQAFKNPACGETAACAAA